MSKVTAGKWRAFGFTVVSGLGKGSRVIADCNTFKLDDSLPFNDPKLIAEDQANARLMAASKKLLRYSHSLLTSLAKYGVAISDLFGHDEEFLDARQKLEDVIKEAGGE